jgi:hypothetical protein
MVKSSDWLAYFRALQTDPTRGAQLLGLVRMAQAGDREARDAAHAIWTELWKDTDGKR